MTKTELKAFRKILEQREEELGNGIRNREALAVETSPDELDRIQHASERDYAMNNFELNSDRLRDVRTALQHMDADRFGICIGCEEEIGPRRLAAIPWASYCINCQEAADRERKTPGNDDIESPLDLAA
jgi:DnaK suppressor protein